MIECKRHNWSSELHACPTCEDYSKITLHGDAILLKAVSDYGAACMRFGHDMANGVPKAEVLENMQNASQTLITLLRAMMNLVNAVNTTLNNQKEDV